MYAFLIMRFVYGLYVILALLILYRTLSLLLFHAETRSWKFALEGIGFAIIWPLALFSRNGRRKLFAAIPFTNGRITRK